MPTEPPSQDSDAEVRAFTDAIWEACRPQLKDGRITGETGVIELFAAGISLALSSGASPGDVMHLFSVAFMGVEEENEHDEALHVTTGKYEQPS